MNQRSGQIRDRHKSHYCIYCKLEVKRIHEHFLRKHAEEDRVLGIRAVADKKKRFWLWKQLTQEGDNYFNNLNKDQLENRKVVKKPHTDLSTQKYYTCTQCLGRIRTTSKKKHQMRCDAVFGGNATTANNNNSEVSQQDLYRTVSERLINKIRLSPHIDSFIKHFNDIKDSKASVRTAMTDLVELEGNMQKVTKVKKSLTQFLCTTYVDDFIVCIKKLCGRCHINNEIIFKFPFRALRICRTIRELIKFMTVRYSKNDMDSDVLSLNKFKTIFEAETEKKIIKQAMRDLKKRKLKKCNSLPKLSHVNYLIQKLKEETPTLMEKLKTEKTAASWRMLAENILIRLTIFNRRRGGAIEKLTIEDYLNTEVRSKVATEEAVYNLDQEDKAFLESVKVVEILHKCNNVIPIVIIKPIQEAMDLLLEHRKVANVSGKNHFFFPAGYNSLNPIRGVKIMEKYRQYLPENVRKLFTATSLRKHGATTTQLLDLSVQDKEEWAHHLGHSVEIHDKYYRNKEVVLGILKTGRILKALDEGTIKFYKGKKIDEIPLTDSSMVGGTIGESS